LATYYKVLICMLVAIIGRSANLFWAKFWL